MEERAVHLREALAADQPRLIELINAAFSVETFIEGTRTDEERLTTMMAKGNILLAEESDGHLLASVYVERRARAKGWDAGWFRLRKTAFASRDARESTLPC